MTSSYEEVIDPANPCSFPNLTCLKRKNKKEHIFLYLSQLSFIVIRPTCWRFNSHLDITRWFIFRCEYLLWFFTRFAWTFVPDLAEYWVIFILFFTGFKICCNACKFNKFIKIYYFIIFCVIFRFLILNENFHTKVMKFNWKWFMCFWCVILSHIS